MTLSLFVLLSVIGVSAGGDEGGGVTGGALRVSVGAVFCLDRKSLKQIEHMPLHSGFLHQPGHKGGHLTCPYAKKPQLFEHSVGDSQRSSVSLL